MWFEVGGQSQMVGVTTIQLTISLFVFGHPPALEDAIIPRHRTVELGYHQFNRSDLLQSDLLKGELLAARMCIVSYEHRNGDF